MFTILPEQQILLLLLSASSIDFLRSFSVASVNPIFHWQ